MPGCLLIPLLPIFFPAAERPDFYKMRLDFLKIVLFISFLTIFFVGNAALAIVSGNNLNPAPLNANVPTGTDFRQIILKITNYLLYLIGTVATAAIVFAGFNYITSAGDEKKIEKAKQILLYAIIGLVVAIVSWVVVNEIIGRVFSGAFRRV